MYICHLKHATDFRVTRDGFAVVVFQSDPLYEPKTRAYYDILAGKLKAAGRPLFKPVLAMLVTAGVGAHINIDPSGILDLMQERGTGNVFVTLDDIERSSYEDLALSMLTEIDSYHDLGLMGVLETVVKGSVERSSWITSHSRMLHSRLALS